jgi:hypothetical protein
MSVSKAVQIRAPNLQTAEFAICGTAPLVVHRFSRKVQQGMLEKMEAGGNARSAKGKREAVDLDDVMEAGKYRSKEGWEGFNASGVRMAMISACRLVGFKMVLAKLSVFVVEDGRDAEEPQVPLVRIYGKARRMEAWARVETGTAYMTVRPCYDEWSAKLRIRFDGDQFTLTDVTHLLTRVGAQVGICEGRPDSKNSAGMGWGTFEVEAKKGRGAK